MQNKTKIFQGNSKKSVEKSLVDEVDAKENIQETTLTEVSSVTATPKSSRTSVSKISQNSVGRPKTPAVTNSTESLTPSTASIQSSRRSVRTALKTPVATESTSVSTPPTRKRKHSEKTEAEEKEEPVSKKRTRESWRDKEKEKDNEKEKETKKKEKSKEKEIKEKTKASEKDKVKESARLKERVATKASDLIASRLKSPPPKESSPTSSIKVKKQSKLDEILMKMSNRPSKFFPSRAREKRASLAQNAQESQQQQQQNHCGSKKEAMEVSQESLGTSRRSRLIKVSSKSPTEEIATTDVKTNNTSETVSSSKVDEAKPTKKQLTIPDMFLTAATAAASSSPVTTPMEDFVDNKNNMIDESTAINVTNATVENEPTASPGEYEGGDEDDGDDDEFVPRAKVASVIQSLDAAFDSADQEMLEESEKLKALDVVDSCQLDNNDAMEIETEDNTQERKEKLDDVNENLKNEDTTRLVESTPIEPIKQPETSLKSSCSNSSISTPKIESVTSNEKSLSMDNDQGLQSQIVINENLIEPRENLLEPKVMSMQPIKKKDTNLPPLLSNHPCVTETNECQPVVLSQEKVTSVIAEQQHQQQQIQQHHHQQQHQHHEVMQIQSQPEEKLHSPESGKTTPHPENPGSVKRTPPSQPDLPSMGVYTPDSTTNSVHSLHYAHCDLDVSQLGLESPTSIASDLASQNSVERPPSVLPTMPNQQTPQTVSVSSITCGGPLQMNTSVVNQNVQQHHQQHQSNVHTTNLQAQQQVVQQQYVECSMPQHTPPHVGIQQQHQQHQMQLADKNPYVSNNILI